MKYFLILIVGSTIFSGCASSNLNQTKSSKFDIAVNEYKAYTKYHKAMAVAMDSDGRYSYGRSWGYATQNLANQRALKECNENRYKHNVRSICEIYMVGNDVVRSLR